MVFKPIYSTFFLVSPIPSCKVGFGYDITFRLDRILLKVKSPSTEENLRLVPFLVVTSKLRIRLNV